MTPGPAPHAAADAAARPATEPALRGLFDHAGMFPPATLPLPAALRDAAGFPASLGRPGLVGADLVLAWKDWPALSAAALAAAGFRRPCRVALVGVPQEQGEAVAREAAAHTAQPGCATPVVGIELHTEGTLDAGRIRATVALAGLIPVFVEPRWSSERLRTGVADAARLLQDAGAGLKVRCAGPTAADRPALAAAVVAAADAGIPLKATQGLHHPVPRPGAPHGFLGLLAAVRLRQANGPGFAAADVTACLAEPDVGAFDLGDGIAWRGRRVPAAQLAALPAFAIGSCSLAEPDDDLMQAFGPAPAR